MVLHLIPQATDLAVYAPDGRLDVFQPAFDGIQPSFDTGQPDFQFSHFRLEFVAERSDATIWKNTV
jgi:hypothetical protein